MKNFLLFTICSLFTWGFAAADDTAFAKAEKVGANFGKTAAEETSPAIELEELKRFVTRLTSKEFEGRLTGEPGERMATAYFAEFLKELGIGPAGEGDSYYENFTYRSGMEFKGDNSLSIIEADGTSRTFKPGDNYQPISVSGSGDIKGGIVFAGFGIDHDSYDNFEGLDVKGKWILVLRGSPENKADLKEFAPLYRKAKIAKEKEAAGILYIKAENPQVAAELIPPSTSIGPPGAILPAITISDELAKSLFVGAGEGREDLLELFKSYSLEETVVGFNLSQKAHAKIGLAERMDPGRNVLGRLVVGEQPSDEAIVIGGHIDHLGYGSRGGSRAKGEEAKKLHPGADDNASGIAVIMELAQYFSDQKRSGELELDRDIIFAGWSGEELGLWGSRHYIKEARKRTDKKVYPGISTYINLDMVGRAKQGGLILNGIDSSYEWRKILEEVTEPEGLNVKRGDSPFVPSDAESFYLGGVPILAAFTGPHDDYHTPRDTVDMIDFPGMLKITHYLKDILIEVSNRPNVPSYAQINRKQAGDERIAKTKVGVRIFPTQKGVRVAEVLEGTPAGQADIQARDLLVSINGKALSKMENFYSEVKKLKAGQGYPVSLKRKGRMIETQVQLAPPRIPFDQFYVTVDRSEEVEKNDVGEALNFAVSISRSSDSEKGKVSFEVSCDKFREGRQMLPNGDLRALSEASKAASEKKAFDKEVVTTTLEGKAKTRYQARKSENDTWEVVMTRDETEVIFSPMESERATQAYRSVRGAMAWYRKLINDEPGEPSANVRPPKGKIRYFEDVKKAPITNPEKLEWFQSNEMLFLSK